jgi:hypothetical protein
LCARNGRWAVGHEATVVMVWQPDMMHDHGTPSVRIARMYAKTSNLTTSNEGPCAISVHLFCCTVNCLNQTCCVRAAGKMIAATRLAAETVGALRLVITTEVGAARYFGIAAAEGSQSALHSVTP